MASTDCRDRALIAKFEAVYDTVRACGIGRSMWVACGHRMKAGHLEHGNDVSRIDAQSEAREELCDVVNYTAIARLQGRWSWRWRLAGWLAGIAWRVLR